MIVVMKPTATEADVDYVVGRASSLTLNSHLSRDGQRVVVGILGDLRALDASVFLGLRGVERVVDFEPPFRLVSNEFRREPTIVDLNGNHIGGQQLTIIAGPCSVESRSQLLETAWAVKEAGAHMLRGGAFKPRTSPYSFQGLGEEGLQILAQAREETGLPVVTEVMAPEQVPLLRQYADVMQIGTRNMHNYNLLRAVGECNVPVLLKRGMMSTIKELLMSAEYIAAQGNTNILLCERGIRSFETYTRNTLDINAVPALKELSHLPVIVDPSHATGKASLVAAVSKAAVAAGADGLLIEVHPDPEHAWSDGMQSLTPQQFGALVKKLSLIAAATGREISERAHSAQGQP